MNKKIKLLCASIIGGATVVASAGGSLAWFIAKSSADVNITSAVLKTDLELKDIALYSADEEYTTGTPVYNATGYYYKPTESMNFAGSGNVVVDEGLTKLTFNNVAPGDRITGVAKLTHKSNVHYKFRLRMEQEDVSGHENEDLFSTLKFVFWNTTYYGIDNVVTHWETYPDDVGVENCPFEIYVPLDADIDPSNGVTVSFENDVIPSNIFAKDVIDINSTLYNINKLLTRKATVSPAEAINFLGSLADEFIEIEGLVYSSKYNLFGIPVDGELNFGIDIDVDRLGDLWTFENSYPTTPTGPVYLLGNELTGTINASNSIDVGANADISEINLTTTEAGNFVIKTNSINTYVNIDAKNASVSHYGGAALVNVIAVSNNSMHEYGNIAVLKISNGHIYIEESASVNTAYLVYDQANTRFNNIVFDFSHYSNLETLPIFVRDVVSPIPEDGLLIAGIKGIVDTNYLWLNQQGLYQQAIVSKSSQEMGDVKIADADVDAIVQKFALTIFNSYDGNYETDKDDSGLVDPAKIIEEGVGEAYINQAIKDFKDENHDKYCDGKFDESNPVSVSGVFVDVECSKCGYIKTFNIGGNEQEIAAVGTITINGSTLSDGICTENYIFNVKTRVIKLLKDFEGNFVFSGKNSQCRLDLNGHILRSRSNEDAKRPAIYVKSGYILTIMDSNRTVKHDGYINEDYVWTPGEATGAPVCDDYPIYGGIITGPKAYTTVNGYSEGIVIDQFSTVSFEGGTIAGMGYDSAAGAIYVARNLDGDEVDSGRVAKLVMSDNAAIVGCTGSTAGAIRMYDSKNNGASLIDFQGGLIDYCANPDEHGTQAGAIYYNGYNCGMTMSGGKISNCYSGQEAGAITCNAGFFTLCGGTIENCYTENNGGAIRRDDGIVTMSSGLIKNCSADYGGAYNGNSTAFVMTGGTIDGCIGRSGSGAFNSNNVVIHGGTIKNCVSLNGGGVVEVSGTLIIDGGEFINNSAVYGAVISMEVECECTITVTGGTYTNNHLSDEGQTPNIYDFDTIKYSAGSTVNIAYLETL